MRAKDYKKLAWSKMHGNWGICAIITLVIAIISSILGATVIGLLLVLPFTYSFAHIALNVCRREKITIEDGFAGFKIFLKAFCLNFLMELYICLWSLLFVIPGIIKSFSYSMSNFILKDNPNMSANEAITESRRMMNGNKWRLFCLYFSFIGWFILSAITFGILLLWIQPYLNASVAEFYRSLKNETDLSVVNSENATTEEVNA